VDVLVFPKPVLGFEFLSLPSASAAQGHVTHDVVAVR
jgi:hypothetical protein